MWNKRVVLPGGILPLTTYNSTQVCWKSGGNYAEERRIWGPFKRLPNVRNFEVELNDYDPLFAKYGIRKRIAPNLKYEPHNNNKLNRYVYHQLKRLEHVNSLTFWRIAMHMVRSSDIFFVMALNHVFPRWHRTMRLSSVMRLFNSVRKIANKPYAKLDYKRVYIPKQNGEWRPLGVPKPEWRMYLHMVNQFLVHYLDSRGYLSPEQHGFRPNRGTMSAWKVILSEVIHTKDIYEFDLKKFFDSVSLDAVSAKLVEYEVPINIVRQLYIINTSPIVLKKAKLNEFEQMMKSLLHKGATPDEIINHPRPLSYRYRVRGVPQGAPTSPVLATITMRGSITERPGLEVVTYADDGLYYGNIGDTPMLTPNSNLVTANIHFNVEKSGWIKKDGVWLKPLKFLGLTYDGNLDKLMGSTRNGSTLIYDKEELVSALQNREENERSKARDSDQVLNSDTWSSFTQSKVFGFIQNRIYTGAWNLDEFEQNFQLTYEPNTYIDRYRGKLPVKLNVFNSTSYASEYLVERLRTAKGSKFGRRKGK